MPEPVGTAPRILPLDFIRGCAVLGILLLNIVAFGLPQAAYLNPAWAGSVSTGSAFVWALMDLFAQIKFLTLFALLFGGGLVLLLPRGARWIQIRLALLVLLGFFHALLFWEGDILFDYGLIGLIVWRMIREATDDALLFRTGVLLYLLGSGVLLLFGLMDDGKPGSGWLPGPAEIQYEQLMHGQGGALALQSRLDAFSSGLLSLGAQYGWQLAGLMMMGAALMRSGWLQGRFSPAHYRRVALWLIPLGCLVNLPGITLQWYTGWNYRWCGFFLQLPRELSAPLQALGYAALAFACWPACSGLRITLAVAQVGRMALSNYLLQTFLCTTLFNHLGLFMAFDRVTLLAIVPAIWVINLLFSHFWLRHFRQGPLEAAWRFLTRKAAGWSSAD